MAETITELPILRAFPSSGTPAKLTLINNRPCIKFDAANQEMLFQSILPDKYIGGSLRVKLFWIADPYVVGNLTWEASYKKLAEGYNYLTSPYTSTKTLITTPLGLDLLNISYMTFTNIELGYDVNSLDELFIMKIKVNALQPASAINLLNVILENV